MSTVLQKAVTPQMSAAYLERGLDRVAGFVVPAADVAAVTRPQDLFELHGLGFPNSPFSPEGPIDILHLPASPTGLLVPARGGQDEAGRRASGGTFLERAPFTGTGTAEAAGVSVPLSWLEHTRITPGARLWRFTADQTEPQLIGTYHGVVFGWQNHLEGDTFHVIAPTKNVGHVARTAEGTFPADITTDDDGGPRLVTVVATTAAAEAHGFRKTAAGTWARQLAPGDVQEIFELHASGRWHGIPVRIVEQWKDKEGEAFCRISSLAHDADLAERLRMDKVDAGVYEATVAMSALTDVVFAQRIPRSWARPGQMEAAAERARRATAQGVGAPAAAPTGPARPAPALAQTGGGLRATVTPPVRTTPESSAAPAGPAAAAGPVAAGTETGVEVSPSAAPFQPAAGEAGTGTGTGTGTGQQISAEHLRRVAEGAIKVAPTGWTRVRVLCRMLGDRGEIMASATRPDGEEVVIPALPQDVSMALAELRHLSYRPGRGTWFQSLVTLEPAGKITVNLDPKNEPKWGRPIEPGQFLEDQRRYARDDEHMPEWFRAGLESAGAAAGTAEGGNDVARGSGSSGVAKDSGSGGRSESS